MQRIKLFEEFILETSSKKLEDINNHIKKMFDEIEPYSITWMLHYILTANANNEDSMKQLSKKYNGYIDCILNDDELTFDMEKAIDNYKKLKDYNKGRIKTGSKFTFNGGFIEETDYEKKTLNAIENILDYYKKNKDVKSVNFHEFVKYVYKMFRLLKKTDKNSEISINNMLGVIVKNGIDILNMEEELYKYGKEIENKNISILNRTCIKAGNLDGDERDNDSTYPVFYTIFWKGSLSPHITISLFVKKKEYILGMGYAGEQVHTDIIMFNKKGEQMSISNKDNLKHLGNAIKGAIQKFGEDEFKKTLDNIFEIFAKNGADVKFSYDELKKNMKNYL